MWRLSVVQSVRTCFPQGGLPEAEPWSSSSKGTPNHCTASPACTLHSHCEHWQAQRPRCAAPSSGTSPLWACRQSCEWCSCSIPWRDSHSLDSLDTQACNLRTTCSSCRLWTCRVTQSHTTSTPESENISRLNYLKHAKEVGLCRAFSIFSWK